MPERDNPLFDTRDVLAAVGLLTRFPVRLDAGWLAARGAASAWAWPLAGLVAAAPAAAVAAATLQAGLPVSIAAGLALAVQALATGALHEDGLADTADGLWGGRDAARRLEIMKDSRIGTYGVLALGLVLGLRWQALAGLFEQGLVFAPLIGVAMLSRAPMALIMAAMRNARGSGLAQSVGRPGWRTAWMGLALALCAGVVLLGGAAIWVAAAVGLAALAVALIAKAKIGGQTGDILGAAQQTGEVAALLTLLVVL